MNGASVSPATAADTSLNLSAGVKPEIVIQGTGASLGHAIEKAVVIGQDEAAIRPKVRLIDPSSSEIAVAQFETAVAEAKVKLKEVQSSASSQKQADIIEFQILALDDPTLIPQIKNY